MAISSANAAAAAKTRRVETLTSGTSWTVPTDVTYVNVTLVGGGQSGHYGNSGTYVYGPSTIGGQVITTTVTTTPGASITYAIGAGGTGNGGTGGTTTFTGATSALGGSGTVAGITAGNAGFPGQNGSAGNSGGAGQIIIEYFL